MRQEGPLHLGGWLLVMSLRLICLVLIGIFILLFYCIFYSGTNESYLDLGSCKIKQKKSLLGFFKKESILETELSRFILINGLRTAEHWVVTHKSASGIDAQGGKLFVNCINAKLRVYSDHFANWLLRQKKSELVGKKTNVEDTKVLVTAFLEILRNEDTKGLELFVKNIEQKERIKKNNQQN
jgi:hypothetical protein